MCLGFIATDSANNRLKKLFSIHGWESVEAEGQLYVLFYVILHKGLEHPQILVSGDFPGTNSRYYI